MSYTFITVNDFEDVKEWKKFLWRLCEKNDCNKYIDQYAVKLNNKINIINRHRFEMIILNHKHIERQQIPEGSIASDPDIKKWHEFLDMRDQLREEK